MSISLIFLIVALVFFVLAAFPVSTRINLIAFGLAFWVMSQLFGSHLMMR